MDFRRQHLKRVSTSSQLTESFKPLSAKGGREQPPGMHGLKARLGLNAFDCEELPSAFDSEDEDGIEMDGLKANTSMAGPENGMGRRAEGHRVVR
jgi:hypothetical protein